MGLGRIMTEGENIAPTNIVSPKTSDNNGCATRFTEIAQIPVKNDMANCQRLGRSGDR
jgi:hypothetical protein